jgi:hypothetical protein
MALLANSVISPIIIDFESSDILVSQQFVTNFEAGSHSKPYHVGWSDKEM